ncbi:MAG: hypothetical protein P8O10_12415 [Pseudorhodobacter sp.]|nr:hypothetical protein [Pseudorhodobacter sp.]
MKAILSALAFLLAAPLDAAAGSFTPPAGCTGWLTVQARACRVSNYYKCTQDAPGDQWRADFDQEGLFFASRIDSEAQWVESIDMSPMIRQTLDPNPEDPASFSELLTGLDTFAFNLSRDNGEQSRVRGFDRLTGRSIMIDGMTLLETQFEYNETDASGTFLRRSRGNEYVHPDWRLFFAGPSEWDGGDGFVPLDGSPLQFIFPGEPGFFSTEPLYECDAVLSNYTPKVPYGH